MRTWIDRGTEVAVTTRGHSYTRAAPAPQAQRVQIARQSDLEYKKKLAKNLAGIKEDGAAKDIPVSPHQGTMFPDGEND